MTEIDKEKILSFLKELITQRELIPKKTLGEHNKQLLSQNTMPLKAGVLCDTCNQELLIYENYIIDTLPPQQHVHCENKECLEYLKEKHMYV